jgi:hypothetical protein
MVDDLCASYNASVSLGRDSPSPVMVFWSPCPYLLSRLSHVVLLAYRPRLSALRPTRPRARVVFSVVGVLSSTLLPGFIGPESSVVFADLPRSAPLPLRFLLSRLGFMEPLALSGSRAVALPGVRRVASSYPVRLQCALVLVRILGLALPRPLAPRRTPI